MSVPPQVMAAMSGQGQQSGAMPGAPGGAPGAAAQQRPTPPQAAPVSKPQDKRGTEAAALTNVQIAIQMLEQAIGSLGSGSDHGKAVLTALKALSPMAAKKDTSDLVPAEIMQMVRSMPQMGGGSDLQRQLLQQIKAGGAQPPQQQAA